MQPTQRARSWRSSWLSSLNTVARVAPCAFVLAACGACPHEATQPQPLAAVARMPPAPAAPPPAPAAPPELHGFWAEYWALQGRAETQRYVFLADARFGWLAPQRDTPKQDPVQRSGRFSIVAGDLVLQVESERFGDGHVAAHTPAVPLTLEIGDCPPNQEAQAVDASYVCQSIGGRAFWRRTKPDSATSLDPETYLH